MFYIKLSYFKFLFVTENHFLELEPNVNALHL